jgi:hypothetical protein
MAGRTPHEAVKNYVEPLRKAISCLSRTVLQASSYRELDTVHALTLNNGAPIPLRGATGLALEIRQNYRIQEMEGERGSYSISTVAYAYTMRDAEERELLAYHWHPFGPSHVIEPHLHFGPAADIGFKPLVKAHIPSGRIAIEDVIRLPIRELGIQPLREDWETVLAES